MRFFPVLVMSVMTLIALPALADEAAIYPSFNVLEVPDTSVTVSAGASQAIVSFVRQDETYILTARLSTLRMREELTGRVSLTDGQGHAMIINSEDGFSRDRFTFQRAGDRVLITSAALGLRQVDLALD